MSKSDLTPAFYVAIHRWVYKNLPKPDWCDSCGEDKTLEAANISQDYIQDISDWEWLCRRCHMTKDGRMNNLKKGGKQPFFTYCTLCSKLEHRARGLCNNHYQNLRHFERYGNFKAYQRNLEKEGIHVELSA